MKPDLRTRAGRRQEILDQIRTHGGFSTFWVTDNQLRASVATDMVKSGEINLNKRKSRFPFHSASIPKQKPNA